MSPCAPAAMKFAQSVPALARSRPGSVTPMQSKPSARASLRERRLELCGRIRVFRSRGPRRSATPARPPAIRSAAAGTTGAISPARTRPLPRRLRSMARRPDNRSPTDAPRPRDRHRSAGRRRASCASAPASRYRPDDSGYWPWPRGSRPPSGEPPPSLLAHEALVDALGDQRVGDFLEEFFVEPGHQPAHLDALADRRPAAAALGPISAPRLSSRYSAMIAARRDRRHAFVDQHRRGAGGIEREKSSRRSQTRSSTSRSSRPYSPSARRTKRECGQNG